MKIGAHVSSAGTLDSSIERAKEIGAEAIQIFVSPPQNWTFKTREESEFEIFRQKAADAKIEPIFLHGVYLINLATPKEINLRNTRVTDDCIASLVRIKTLQKVWLGETRVTAKGRSRLRSALPRCEIDLTEE